MARIWFSCRDLLLLFSQFLLKIMIVLVQHYYLKDKVE